MQVTSATTTARQHTAVAVTLGAILLVAAALRLPALDRMAPFVDEAGHILLATDYSIEPFSERLRFGKMFGYVAFYPTARFADEPLRATRELVAFVGVLTTLGVFLFTRRIASPGAALVSSLIWATMPYVVFHDRMALHDPIVSACIVWSLVLMNLALDSRSRVMAGSAGLLLGLAVLTKVTAIVAIVWPVLAGVELFGVEGLRRRAGTVVGFAAGLTVPVSLMAFGILFMGLGDSSVFLIQKADAWSWAGVWANLGNVPSWFAGYNSMPFTVLAGATFVYALSRPSWLKSGLCACFLVSISAHALVFKAWFPRYLLFMLVPLVVLIGIVIAEWVNAVPEAIRRRSEAAAGHWLALATLVGLSVLVALSARHWLASDAALLRDPSAASMPPVDRYQYFDGWPSGQGIETVATYLNRQVRDKGPALVIVGGFGNHGWWSLPLVPKLDPRLVIRSQHLFSTEVLATVAIDAKQQPTFILFEPTRYEAPAFLEQASPQPKLVFEYKRPRSTGGFQLYSLDPSVVVASSIEEARRLEAHDPVVMAVRNPNGAQSLDGQAFFWVASGGTVVEIVSQASGKVELSATYVPGPSATGPTRRLTISGVGFTAQESVGLGKKVVRVPVRPGTNLVTLSYTAPATVPKQPSGDTRGFVLGVQGLRVTAFTPEPAAVTQPATRRGHQ